MADKPTPKAIYSQLKQLNINNNHKPIPRTTNGSGPARPSSLYGGSPSTTVRGINGGSRSATPETPSGSGERRMPRAPLTFNQLKIPIAPRTSNETNGSSSNMFSQFKNELKIKGNTYKVTQADFEVIRQLGQGACGLVQEVVHRPTQTKMAVKRMRRTQDPKEARRIFTDLEIVIQDHQCASIVNSYGAYVTDEDVCICMEPMDACLQQIEKKMTEKGLTGIPEKVLGPITAEVLNGLHYLKQQLKVIHRDVKPSNILINRDGLVKICDFGIAGNLVDSMVHSRDQGSPRYMSPERIDPPVEGECNYDIRADVWSLGITLHELAYNKYPFTDTNIQFELMTEILESPSPALRPEDGFSGEFVDFVGLCLSKKVEERPKYDVLLQHPFILRHRQPGGKEVIGQWFSELMR